MPKTILEPIDTLPGVEPVTEKTNVSTRHYTNSDKVRFVGGVARKIQGWVSNAFDYGDLIDGTVRSLFAEVINGKYYNILGSHKKLYSLIGSRLVNITPFQTAAVAAADSLDTHYDTLGSNPFAAVSGSPTVTVTDSGAANYIAGDTVYFSGATAFAGFLAGDLNGDHFVRSVGSGTYTINIGKNATSTASGGGASVDRSSGLVTVNKTAHGQANGDRVNVDNAADTGGITAAQINVESIIRNVTANTFDIMTLGQATSSVSGGGGASTEYYPEITDGLLDETNVIGYGAGMYGLGLYGTALVSDSARAFPRIWFMDRYGETVIMTAGNQTPVYQWSTSSEVAPVLVTNAPTAVNYAFISDNILNLFGEGGVENRITGSDQGDITNYTSSTTNQVFRDDIEGAGRLISHCPVEDYNLIFTENKTYTHRYIGLPFVWEILPLDETIGIIAAMARVSVKGVGFWMGQENFYMYRGGVVEVIPSNSGHESTLLRYVFDDINWGQKSKCFAWYNKQYNEVWFHYPSADSMEPNRVAAVNILDFTWVPHNLDRTAAEYPNVKLRKPRLINAGLLYQHEIGNDDDTTALPFTLTSNRRFYGKDTFNIHAVIPDSVTSHDLTFTDVGKLYPQTSADSFNTTVPVTPTTDRIPLPTSARFHQYTWEGNALGQEWIMGTWLEEVQKSAPE